MQENKMKLAPAPGVRTQSRQLGMRFLSLLAISGVLIAGSATTPNIASVVNGASLLPAIGASTWIRIQGTNLSATTQGVDPVSSNLPTVLDGVSVKVNGIAAYLCYISPTQLNVLAPDDSTTGEVQVQITNANGASNSETSVNLPLTSCTYRP
jgi:hypothetical protein